MWNAFAQIRYISIIAVITSFAGSLFMFGLSAKKAVVAVLDYIEGNRPEFVPEHITDENLVMGRFIIVLDTFLLAIILLYFGYAMYSILIKKDKEITDSDIPSWLLPSGLGDLKETLAQALIILLFILTVQTIWLNLDHLTLELLVLPASIVLLAGALRIVGFKEKK